MEGSGWRCRNLRFQLDGQWWMVNGELSIVNSRRCWSFDQQPKVAGSFPVAKIILFQRFACWSKDQHGLKLWMVNGESTSIFLLVNYNANSSSKLSVIHLNRRPTPSAVVIPDGGWLNTATIDWMVSGENSAILLFLKYNVLLTSTLSVFSYQFGLLVRKIRFPLLTIDHSQLTIRLHSRRAA